MKSALKVAVNATQKMISFSGPPTSIFKDYIKFFSFVIVLRDELVMNMPVATKIYFTSSRPRAAATAARNWRLVLVPDNNNSLDVLVLYNTSSGCY